MFLLAAENWGEEPLLMAVTILIGNSGDSDSDFVPDSVDNCADVKNYSQEDSDLDGVGDACVLAAAEEEPAELDDEDYDGVMDESDLCAGTADGAAVDENGCSEAQLAASDTLPVDEVLGPTAASDEGFCSLVETSAGTGPLPFALILMFLAIRRRRS